MTDKQSVTLPISFEELDELVEDIERDFGWDYCIDEGLAAVEKLRALLDQCKPQLGE